jgi:hypothetical protein
LRLSIPNNKGLLEIKIKSSAARGIKVQMAILITMSSALILKIKLMTDSLNFRTLYKNL